MTRVRDAIADILDNMSLAEMVAAENAGVPLDLTEDA